MKNMNAYFAGGALLFNLLFYHQLPGINYLLFGLLVLGGMVYLVPDIWQWWSFRLMTAVYGLSGLAVLLNGQFLAAIACWFTIAVLAGIYAHPRSSVLTAVINSLYAVVAAPLSWIKAQFRVRQELVDAPRPVAKKGSRLAVLIPILFILLFTGLYMGANPVFDQFVQQLDWSFLTWSWIGFGLVGFFILIVIFQAKSIRGLTHLDENPELEETYIVRLNKKLTRFISLQQEAFSGMLLLISLNVLLLLVNGLDIYYLYIMEGLPADMSKAAFVHQGVGNLITSILLAIGIILFYFRRPQNAAKSSMLLWAAYGWILQNGFLVISTGFRNTLYVQEFSLTYQRIGVYVYLLLALCGLAFTFIKILKDQPTWCIVRNFGWACLATLVLASFVNWDARITAYNIRQAKADERTLDVQYLLSLGYGNLPMLKTLARKPGKVQLNMQEEAFQQALNQQVALFKRDWKRLGVPSWCWRKKQVYENLTDK